MVIMCGNQNVKDLTKDTAYSFQCKTQLPPCVCTTANDKAGSIRLIISLIQNLQMWANKTAAKHLKSAFSASSSLQ